MTCPNCGFENESGSRFCKQCGTPQIAAAQEPYAPPQPAYNPPPQPAYNPPSYTQPDAPVQQTKKKSKAGLIIGICAGVLVIAAVAVALIFLLPSGPSVEGYWVNEDEGIVLSLEKDGALMWYSLAGSVESDYDFDSKTGEGDFKADKIKYAFTVDEDRLKLTNTDTDDTLKFSRAEEEPEIEEIITAQLIGLWTNEQLGEVLELKEDGKAESHNSQSNVSGDFEFDKKNGECTVTFDSSKYIFTSDGESLKMDNGDTYTKASDNMNIEEFIAAHSNGIIGIWYDSVGVSGTIEFLEDGTYIFTSGGVPYYGTFTFDGATGTGDFTSDYGTSGTMNYSDGILYADGIYFTKEYVEQQTESTETYSEITGTWYESTGDVEITFYDDGTYYKYDYVSSTSEYGTYTYNTANQYGTITNTSTYSSEDFSITGETMTLDYYTYTKDYANTSNSIEGIWFDTAGQAGSIDFFGDNTVVMDYEESYLYGTYEYDTASNYGTMQFEKGSDTLNYTLYLYSGELYIYDAENNMVLFTRDYVSQN